MQIPTLKGERIKLRRLKRSDAESIARHVQDREIAMFMTLFPNPYELRHASEWINRSHRYAKNDTGCHFGIEDIDDNEIIGCIGLNNINRHDMNAEVGYWISGNHRRKGYMTKALDLIMQFAFEELQLHRVYAIVHSQNTGSIKVLEHAGFVREGTWRNATLTDDRWHDVYAYGIIDHEFTR